MVDGFGRPAPLEGFGLSRPETERLFSALDEDYHISRYFHFSDQRVAESGSPDAVTLPPDAIPAFRINGFPHTHVTIDAKIEEVL